MTEFKAFSRRQTVGLLMGFGIAGCTAPDSPTNPPIETTHAGSSAWQFGVALPYAIQEIYPCQHNGRIHLAGGLYAQDGQIAGATSRHVSWAPGEPEWREEAPLVEELHHPQLISHAGRLKLIGGFAREGDAGWIMRNHNLALIDGRWAIGRPLPQPNGESVTSVLGANLHVCGGRVPKGTSNRNWQDHTDTSDHFVQIAPNDNWDTATPLPTARNSAASAVIDGQWHVVGGRTVSGGNTPAHEVYDPSEDRWRTAAPMPQGQAGLAAGTIAGKLYAFGGEFFDNGGGVYPEAWVYDPDADAWTSIPDMPNPRHGLGAVAVKDAIYVIGGALQAGGNQTSDVVEVFQP
ncbi:MAG: kelch repeat-containing protein [Pseudomonadota bacterium]